MPGKGIIAATGILNHKPFAIRQINGSPDISAGIAEDPGAIIRGMNDQGDTENGSKNETDQYENG